MQSMQFGFFLVTRCLQFFLVLTTTALAGCLEASFVLAPESRLPKWFDLPEGFERNDFVVTMDSWTVGPQVFKIRKKDGFFLYRKISIHCPNMRPLKPLKVPFEYPVYLVFTYEGVIDIVEHRAMEPVFYMTDDPVVWSQLDLNRDGPNQYCPP